MKRTAQQLRDDALSIWRAGVDAVRGDRLVREHVRVEAGRLIINNEPLDLSGVRRIVAVGAGKAGAAMSAGLEAALGEPLMSQKQLSGWINVPDDCVAALQRIKLHGARPAGLNEPTAAGAAGTDQILRLVQSLTADDLCLALISGGGSALLPAPVEGVTLADKQLLTRRLSEAGANIQQLNTVRKQLSRIKGGGLARACRAGRLIALIISDVIGDPLDVIASGPTVVDASSPQAALEVLEKFGARQWGVSPAVFQTLQRACERPAGEVHQPRCQVTNHVIGNNAVAVEAAGREAARRGYWPVMMAAAELEGTADDVGRRLAIMALRMGRPPRPVRLGSGRLVGPRTARRTGKPPGPDCLISGGEPVVKLVEADRRGVGGRNQQLVLAALDQLLRSQTERQGQTTGDSLSHVCEGLVLLSGGADGEDGPTDAAGAIIDASVVQAMQQHGLHPQEFLRCNDAYHFFEPLGGLIKTGPTHTNVCDLRVAMRSE